MGSVFAYVRLETNIMIIEISILQKIISLEAIKLNPSKSEYFFNLGNACYAQGKYKSSLEHYNNSLKLHYDPETLSCIGNSLRSIGKFSEAMKFYTTALKENPDLIHTEIELTHLKQNVCDWNNISAHFGNIKSSY